MVMLAIPPLLREDAYIKTVAEVGTDPRVLRLLLLLVFNIAMLILLLIMIMEIRVRIKFRLRKDPVMYLKIVCICNVSVTERFIIRLHNTNV